MKKTFVILYSFLFMASNLLAQNITATLGGNTDSDYYDVKDNTGAVLFRINGTGQTGVGTTNLIDALNIYGGINCEADTLLSINGEPVFTHTTQNVFLGKSSGNNILTGSYNSCFGMSTGQALTTGARNTLIGLNAGRNNTEGEDNTFIGSSSGENNMTGDFNTFVGANAGTNSLAGIGNTSIGYGAGWQNETGNGNVLLGYYAGRRGNDVYYNVMIGYQAGENSWDGSSNVFIGYQAGMDETGSNLLYIENSSSATPLIYGDFSSDELTINGDLTVTGTITELSDERYKTDIQPVKNALQKINSINAVYYNWDKKNHPELVVSDEREIGVIAQEIEKVFPELVKTDKNGFKSVNYAKLSAVLLQVVKEQQSEIAGMKEKLNTLENKYSEQANAIYELTKAFVSLQKENEIKTTSNIK